MDLGTWLNTIVERVTGRRLMKPPPRRVPPARRLDTAHVYLRIAELRRRQLEPVDTSRPIDLRLAELKVFSQNGEDGIIDELVRQLQVRDHWFVEFGVQDGLECNTRVLAEVMGWTGLYFEPSEPEFRALERRWAGSGTVTVVNQAVSPERVGELFDQYHVPEEFGLLSIDVDGQDHWIWEALPDRYRPAIVIVECNSSFPRGAAVVEQRGLAWTADHSDTFGASIEALKQLGARRGYTLVHVDLAGVNAVFVRVDRLADRQVVGITSRSANYDLSGNSHPSTPIRPTVTP